MSTAPLASIPLSQRNIVPPKTLSPENLRRFHDMVDDYPNKRSMLMMTLRLIE